MKIKITLEIEYDDPECIEDYNELIETIKSHYDNDACIHPSTPSLWIQSYSPIEIESNYIKKNGD